MDQFVQKSIHWLTELIRIPSLSKEEDLTAKWIFDLLKSEGAIPFRSGNNIWALSKNWNDQRPTLLLNSHIDTVKPALGWTFPPFEATRVENKIIGLGSNDAGASLIGLLSTFLYLNTQENLSVNLVFAATAEEEISGKGGIESIFSLLPSVDMAIVGEPTQMQMAVAEKGLLVIDAYAKGISGHAARNEGKNAIVEALTDLNWIQNFSFPKVSEFLGPVKMSVTQINAGTQHNVVPDNCHFVIDIRTNEFYSNEEIFHFLKGKMRSELKARSFRLASSQISLNHPLVCSGLKNGLTCFGSPTLSDQALMPFPSLKIGIGDSARSHTADEFIFIDEIEHGIKVYAQLIKDIQIPKN